MFQHWVLLLPFAAEITYVPITVSYSWSNGDAAAADDNHDYDRDSQASALGLPPTTENPGVFTVSETVN